jgi:DNA-binding transcriptional ArsR family regulator
MALMDVFEAVADPTRRKIVQLVGPGELSAGEIASRFEVTRPAVSRHLRVLREAGVLASRGEAQRRLYRVEPAAFEPLDAWLARTRLYWSEHLASLEKHLDTAATK